MKRSMSKSLLSLTVTVSVVLSWGMACFASSTVNCDTIKIGDVIEEGTVIVDVYYDGDDHSPFGSGIYVYSWSDYGEIGSVPRTKIQDYDTWTADQTYTVFKVVKGRIHYDLFLLPGTSPLDEGEYPGCDHVPGIVESEQLTPEQIRALSVTNFTETMYDRIIGGPYYPGFINASVDQLMDQGGSGSDLVRSLLTNDQYVPVDGSERDAVLELYSDLFNRTPSEAELDNWINAIENGATREEVLDYFLSSPEWEQVCVFYGVQP